MTKKYSYTFEPTEDHAMGYFSLRHPDIPWLRFTVNNIWQLKVTSGDSLMFVYTFFSPKL